MINIGQYIESAINWMMVHFSTFFDAVNSGIGSFIIGFQHVLFGIPFYITILALAVAAWMKAGRGTAIFTVLGLSMEWDFGKQLCKRLLSFCRLLAWLWLSACL